MYANRLTLAGLGEDVATSLGVNYNRIVLFGTALISVAVGIVAAVIGHLPFLGLIVPNIVSMFRGDDLRSNLPWVCVIGMGSITACDIISRTIIQPFELPVSLILCNSGSSRVYYYFIETKKTKEATMITLEYRKKKMSKSILAFIMKVDQLALFGLRRKQRRYWILLITLIALGLLSSYGLLVYNNPVPIDSPSFIPVVKRRIVAIVAMIIAAVCHSLSTVAFQSITNNKIITPSLLGFESLYSAIQTSTVFFFGASALINFNGIGSFYSKLLLWSS